MAPTSCCRHLPAWRCCRVMRCCATTSRAWCRCWNARVRAASGQIRVLWKLCHGVIHGLVMLLVDRSQHCLPHRVGESYRAVVFHLSTCFTLLKEQAQPCVPPAGHTFGVGPGAWDGGCNISPASTRAESGSPGCHDASLFSSELGLPTDNFGRSFIDLEVMLTHASTKACLVSLLTERTCFWSAVNSCLRA